MAASAMDLSEFEDDPRLFLFTSLTAGSSHIITATSRMETILKANKIPFQAIDTATDEKARRLWQRRASKRKLPGLVKDGFVIADLEEVEEWNEFGELKENIGPVPANNAANSATGVKGVNIRPPEATSPQRSQGVIGGAGNLGTSKAPKPLVDETKIVPLPGAAEIAARGKAEKETEPTTAAAEKEKGGSANAAKAILKDDHPGLDHLSAPPSAMQSGTATPQPEPEAAGEAVEEPNEAAVVAEKVDETPVEKPTEEPAPRRASLTHRGSEVKEAPSEEIKKIEDENALQEEDEDEHENDMAAKGLAALDVKDGEKTQVQDAKDGEEATTSVKD